MNKNKGIGFFWSEGETYLKAWSEPVFGFYDKDGDKQEVGLGDFSPGSVQGFNPNSNPNTKSSFLVAFENGLVEHFSKIPEYVIKIMNDFLMDEEKEVLKLGLMLKKKKEELKRVYEQKEIEEKEKLLK